MKSFFRIKLSAYFGLSNYEPNILGLLKRNSLFNNTDATIQTFKIAIKEDIKNYKEDDS